MKRLDFIACSLVFHAALVVVAFLLPAPFPSGRTGEEDYAYVELTPLAMSERPSAAHEPDLQDAPRAENSGGRTGCGREAQTPRPAFQAAPSDRPVSGSGAAQSPEKAQPVPQTPKYAPSAVPGGEAPGPSFTLSISGAEGVSADKDVINFKHQKGWPVPGMVRVTVGATGGPDAAASWRAAADAEWIILSPVSGSAPDVLKVGVDTSRLSLGYYEGRVRITPVKPGLKGDELTVSVMVLPKSPGVPELPHSSWDAYMDGNCKVCHLPKEVLPSEDFLGQPEFCGLCHNPSGMAQEKTLSPGGHPVLVAVNSGGTKTPTLGTVAAGPKSDRMASHLKDGRLIACVTCHNVMEKPGDYGRTWEMTFTKDGRTYFLDRGGWENMGCIEPKVYASEGLMRMPRFLKDARKYLVGPDEYGYDEAEGTVTFKSPRKKGEAVYVTLGSPYLRVTTEGNRLCFDCHFENTHQGLSCLSCHKAHGTPNIMGIRPAVRTPEGASRRVVFRARKGKGSFADGGPVYDGICEVCHTRTNCHRSGGGGNLHADGRDYSGTDCTACHPHKDGFGI